MRKDAQAMLLLLVGGTLLKISFAGTFLRYVKPSSRWLLIAAGAVLVVVALATLWQVVWAQVRAGRKPALSGRHAAAGPPGTWPRAVQAHPLDWTAPSTADPPSHVDEHARPDHDHTGAGHEHNQSFVGWLLVLPAMALLVLAPPAIGSFQAARSGTALTAPADTNFAPLPDGDPVRISVLDYASRAVFDNGRSLMGRHVTLSGFVMPGPNGTPYLARMIVTCCAADARPIKVGLTGAIPPDLKPDDWIDVDGSYTSRTDSDPVNHDTIPYLQVSAVRTIPAPASQYES